MSEEELKPDVEALLDELNKGQDKNGTVKIFLGYAPGVGKTYSMLEKAVMLKNRGIDVVIGVVETHGRKETQELLEGLEILPLKEISYKGMTVKELDVDGVIRRKPKLVLIDELAHTNVEGSVRLKRYQDVQEILEHGINVYTAVNIQHFESVNDVVASVTGIKVSETVPDFFLDKASEIEVVDIPIEELHQRLNDGKVYIPEQARRAIDQFFKRSNLLALREIALRRVATKLDEELVTYMKARAIAGPWPTVERLMVCVGTSPFAKQLIRKAFKLADDMKAEWYAVYVDSIAQIPDDSQRAQLAETLELAEELGAKVLTVSGADTAEEILRFATQEKVTKIIMGKPRTKGLLGRLAGSPVSRIVNSRRDIDVYLIEPVVEKEEEKRVKKVKKWVPDFKPRDYVLSVLMIVPIILLGFLLSYFKIQNFALIFIIGVTASAFLFGMWPSMFVSVLSILAYDFFFVKPIFTFTITNPVYIVELIIFFATSFGVAEIARIFRHQREAIRMRLENIRLLEQMGRELLTMPSIEQLLDNTVEDMKPETRESIQLLNVDILEQVADITSGYIKKAYNVPNLILFKDRDDKIKIWARSDTSIEFTQNDYAIAAWVYTNGELAGRGTKTLVGSKFVFVPMESKTSTVGVIILHGDYSEMLPQEKYFVTAIANFAAISAEKCTTIMGSKK